jgi:3-deoxy-D-manno-octulosonic acid kinase
MNSLALDNEMVWYDPELVGTELVEIFNPNYWREKHKITGHATGRGTTWFVDLEHLEGALRHYRRGGMLGKLVQDSYFFSGWESTRSFQEFQLLNIMKDAGLHVPRPIAARAVKRGPFYTADLLSEKIPKSRDLVSILQEAPLPAEIYQKIGREIRKMHDLQVNHTDLNIHNILIDDDDKVWLIDFDKCYQQPGDEWKTSNLARLKRSFEKELHRRNIHWSQKDWSHLEFKVNI